MSNNVKAALFAEQAGEGSLTLRQQVDRMLIIATASWRIGNHDAARNAFDFAMSNATRCKLPTLLYNVPHAALIEIATQFETEAGAHESEPVATLEAIPAQARSKVYERLTEMEVRTLEVIAEAGSINEAAEALFLTTATVKKHLSAVYRKLGVRNREEAVLLATRMSVLAPVTLLRVLHR